MFKDLTAKLLVRTEPDGHHKRVCLSESGVHKPRTTPHFVPDLDKLVVLEMPRGLRHGRMGACTAQEQPRPSQGFSCIA